MGEQGGEGGVQLVEGRVFEGLGVHLLDNLAAAFEHLGMDVEAEAVEVAPLAFVVFAAEFGFFGAPFFQGFGGDAEKFGGAGEIAFELVDLIEGVDFGAEWVSAFHAVLLLCC